VPGGLPHRRAVRRQLREVLNTDSSYYGGSNLGNGLEPLPAEEHSWMGVRILLC